MTTAAQPASWIATSNEHAKVVLAHVAAFHPEVGSLFGLPDSDTRIVDLGPGIVERKVAAGRTVLQALQAKVAAEREPNVRQDLAIMIDLVEREIDRTLASSKLLVPYGNIPEIVFRGMHTLLLPHNPPERRKLAVERLARYAGTGGTPLLEDAAARWREKAEDKTLLGPSRVEV